MSLSHRNHLVTGRFPMQPCWLHLEPNQSVSCCLSVRFPMEPFRHFARPSKGWSVNILPVRSTVVAEPQRLRADHAFKPAAEATGCATLAGLFACASDASEADGLRIRSLDAAWRVSGAFR